MNSSALVYISFGALQEDAVGIGCVAALHVFGAAVLTPNELENSWQPVVGSIQSELWYFKNNGRNYVERAIRCCSGCYQGDFIQREQADSILVFNCHCL
jgi:hypothetical protein